MGSEDAGHEVELLLRCADGDDRAWSEFLRSYGAFLDYMIRRALMATRGGRLPSPDEVTDIRDEVVAWLAADEGRVLRTYRGESRITSWLGVVVGRRARRIARRGAGLASRTVSLDALTADATSHLALEASDGGGDARQAALTRLADALEELPERDRALLKGAFFDRRSYEELARDLGVRTDSVGQLLFRAKRKLKKVLGGEAFLERLSGFLVAVLSLLTRGG